MAKTCNRKIPNKMCVDQNIHRIESLTSYSKRSHFNKSLVFVGWDLGRTPPPLDGTSKIAEPPSGVDGFGRTRAPLAHTYFRRCLEISTKVFHAGNFRVDVRNCGRREHDVLPPKQKRKQTSNISSHFQHGQCKADRSIFSIRLACAGRSRTELLL